MKHPPSIMVWGAMSALSTAGLYFLQPGTIINGAKYLDLLKDKLKIHMVVHDRVARLLSARGSKLDPKKVLNSSKYEEL